MYTRCIMNQVCTQYVLNIERHSFYCQRESERGLIQCKVSSPIKAWRWWKRSKTVRKLENSTFCVHRTNWLQIEKGRERACIDWKQLQLQRKNNLWYTVWFVGEVFSPRKYAGTVFRENLSRGFAMRMNRNEVNQKYTFTNAKSPIKQTWTTIKAFLLVKSNWNSSSKMCRASFLSGALTSIGFCWIGISSPLAKRCGAFRMA